MKLLPLILALLLTCLVAAFHNVTIDDSDSSITYFPSSNWDPDKSQASPLDIGGSHTVSVDANATATLTFTGYAVYYMSPKWPFPISVAISVDNGLSNKVDLMDYNSSLAANNSSETVQSQALWGWTSPQLTNESHTVVVSMGKDSTFVVVDGFNYTVLDPDDLSTTLPASFSTSPTAIVPSLTSPTSLTTVPASFASSSTPPAYDTSTANAASSSNKVTHNSVPVIAGTVGGVVVLIGVVVVVVSLVWVRRKSRPSLHDFWD